jgi:tRNA-splicing ligase RtcB
MLEYQGKYGKAKVMIDDIDQATVSQIFDFLNHQAFTNQIAIMPDTHAGAGAVIGFTMPMTDEVIPNVIGVDIGCGMYSLNVGNNIFAEHTKEEIDDFIRDRIPFGPNVRTDTMFSPEMDDKWKKEVLAEIRLFTMAYNKKFGTKYDLYTEIDYHGLCFDIGLDFNRFAKSIGTLGGGNHFIEIGKSQQTGNYWLTIHSGSRQFGLKVAQYHQRKAGKGALSYLKGEDAFDYLIDMVIAQKYAELNREAMAKIIVNGLDMDVRETIVSVHNYIDFNDFIIRKGAIASYENQVMIIPFNMEDGLLICEGKSNPEWNFSAPHGAGRLGSRSWAKKKFKRLDVKSRMNESGIYTSVVPTDEIKEAYKDPKIIEDAIGPTAEIKERIKPIINMKSR